MLTQDPTTGEEQLIIVALDTDGPAAAAVYGRTIDSPGRVCRYLAARPGERGTRARRPVLSPVCRRSAASTVHVVLGEVHDPRFYAETSDEQPTARLRFYERHGAERCGALVQPRLSDGTHRVLDMLLLALYASPDLVEHGVPSSWIAEWTEHYFVAEEGAVPDDPDYEALVGRMVAEPAIDLIPVSRVETVERLELADADDARTTDPPRT